MLCIEFVNLLYKIRVIEKSKGAIKNIQPRDTDITGHKTQNKAKQKQKQSQTKTKTKQKRKLYKSEVIKHTKNKTTIFSIELHELA